MTCIKSVNKSSKTFLKKGVSNEMGRYAFQFDVPH